MLANAGVPEIPSQIWNYNVPAQLSHVPERVLQASILVCFIVSLDRLRVVRSAFQQVLNVRYDIAVSDSALRIKRNAAAVGSAEDYFTKSENFGADKDIEVEEVE